MSEKFKLEIEATDIGFEMTLDTPTGYHAKSEFKDIDEAEKYAQAMVRTYFEQARKERR